jgi:hypothetical protein
MFPQLPGAQHEPTSGLLLRTNITAVIDPPLIFLVSCAWSLTKKLDGANDLLGNHPYADLQNQHQLLQKS